jgi:hypothetical protein
LRLMRTGTAKRARLRGPLLQALDLNPSGSMRGPISYPTRWELLLSAPMMHMRSHWFDNFLRFVGDKTVPTCRQLTTCAVAPCASQCRFLGLMRQTIWDRRWFRVAGSKLAQRRGRLEWRSAYLHAGDIRQF